MNENTVDYILGELSKQRKFNVSVQNFASRADGSYTTLTKTVSNLSKQYKTISAFSIICVAFGYFGVKKIKELENEIKELKKLKGD